ncbi:MAG: PKD domain-containing protein [Methanotrichaceae archaeon]
MNVRRGMNKVLFAALIIQVLAICAAFCIFPCSGESSRPEDASSIASPIGIPVSSLIAGYAAVDDQASSDSATNGPESTIYIVTIQGHVTSVYEGCYYGIYVDKILMGYGLEGLSGFRLVPGTTIETTPVTPCPDISMGDCVEVRGYWSTTDSPPIYIESPGGYINKIACSTTNTNHPPIIMAKPSGPKTGYIGTSYIYTAYASDPDGDHMEYTFDWGDRSTSETGFIRSGTSASLSHTWNDAGIYWVKVKATDNNGASSSWSKPMIVTIKQKSKPVTPAAPTGPTSGNVGIACKFTIAAASPDQAEVRYIFDWGDGTTSETGFIRSGRLASISHTWSDTGIYWVKARAIDSTGAASSWSKPLIVTIKQKAKPNTPTSPTGPTLGGIGMLYKFAIAGMDSNKGFLYSYATSAVDNDKAQMKYIFDWGDGTTSETGSVIPGRLVSISHAWSDAGVYWVKARAIDGSGASSSWSKPLIVTIKQNYRPAAAIKPTSVIIPAKPAGSTTGGIGKNDKFSTSAMDPNKIFVIPSIDPLLHSNI